MYALGAWWGRLPCRFEYIDPEVSLHAGEDGLRPGGYLGGSPKGDLGRVATSWFLRLVIERWALRACAGGRGWVNEYDLSIESTRSDGPIGIDLTLSRATDDRASESFVGKS